MLDVIVLIAMAVTAAAFAVGLILHSGIAQIPALIAAAALYMVMAASYLMVARSSRPSGAGGDRLDDLEQALEIIDKDLQRIDRVEEDVSRLEVLSDRVERLDQTLSEYAATGPIGGLSRREHVGQEFEEIHARIETLRTDLEGEAKNQREKMSGDLRMLEGLIKQLSRELIGVSGAEPGIMAAAAAPAVTSARSTAAPPPMPEFVAEVEKIEPEAVHEDEPEPAEALVVPESVTVITVEEDEVILLNENEPLRGLDDDEDAPLRGEVEEIVSLEEDVTPPAASRTKEAPVAAKAPPVAEIAAETMDTASLDDTEMLEIMSQAIEAGRVDLYLQPVVTLPERTPRYFEALTRIRGKSDKLILPGSYLKVAEGSGMMPLIDNVLLVKSVQTLRRLGANSRIKGVFCNISVNTLLDAEFFPELVEFMEENAGLSESLIFEVSQPAILSLNEAELGALDTLGALGYGFSLDHVADLDIDFVGLRDRFFRFIKIDAKTFLGDMKAKGASFSAADMKRALDDFDMQLIVEKVENEVEVAKLLDHGVELAQGYLFGRPKPMSPALFREIADADAA
ncbi:MAG TPA: EAL domain-containing protein [Methyloceanibacter sp.]|nr:EAL domain-containing protein [Methyloceanibacter sp.]